MNSIKRLSSRSNEYLSLKLIINNIVGKCVYVDEEGQVDELA